MNKQIEKAISSIGSNAPDDYKITPTKFPEELAETAPEISEILRYSNFQEIASRYEKYDASAILSQGRFKKFAHQSTWAICFAALSGSLLAVLPAANLAQGLLKWFSLILGLFSMFGGGLAVFRLHQIKSEKLLEGWMTDRANAETERLGYFYSLSRYLVKKHKENAYLQLLFLCMFKRYQLEVQRNYYTIRGGEHRTSLRKTSLIGAVAALWLALGSGMIGMFGAFSPELLPFAALGTIGAAISALASRREELNQDERNAERYNRTVDILSKIAERHDDVLDIIEKGGKPEIITEYVNAVNDPLSLEHRQWISNVSEMSSTMATLNKSISDLHKE